MHVFYESDHWLVHVLEQASGSVYRIICKHTNNYTIVASAPNPNDTDIERFWGSFINPGLVPGKEFDYGFEDHFDHTDESF